MSPARRDMHLRKAFLGRRSMGGGASGGGFGMAGGSEISRVLDSHPGVGSGLRVWDALFAGSCTEDDSILG